MITSSKMEFGLIPREHWFQPDWIDEERAKASRDQMVTENVIYGGARLAISFYLCSWRRRSQAASRIAICAGSIPVSSSSILSWSSIDGTGE